jgi:hypothetical protein
MLIRTAAAIAVGWAGSALAWQPEVAAAPGDGEARAYILFHNRLTPAHSTPTDETYTLATEAGVVTIRHERGLGMLPDTISVVAAPPGIVPVPFSLTLPETEKGRIALMEWSGM